jgi:precorrin-6A synthase
MKKLMVIGIGAGNPDYITMQAVKALNVVDVFFLMDKGQSKDKLIDLRREICERYIGDHPYRFVEAHSPERERGDVDYKVSVDDLNLAKQLIFERLINEEISDDQCGGFLVWGDPALYDSTIRILQAILASGRCVFEFEVIPGITSVQALAAQHKVPLNQIGGSVEITTGRRLAAGQVSDADSLVVMLDAEDSYRQVADQETEIYWGGLPGDAG